jgi:hypothetical protein
MKTTFGFSAAWAHAATITREQANTKQVSFFMMCPLQIRFSDIVPRDGEIAYRLGEV